MSHMSLSLIPYKRCTYFWTAAYLYFGLTTNNANKVKKIIFSFWKLGPGLWNDVIVLPRFISGFYRNK